MAFDYSKLRGKIKEKFGTQYAFACAIGKSEAAISGRLNNQTDFTQDEILLSCDLLGIGSEEIAAYFFTPEVQKRER